MQSYKHNLISFKYKKIKRILKDWIKDEGVYNMNLKLNHSMCDRDSCLAIYSRTLARISPLAFIIFDS